MNKINDELIVERKCLLIESRYLNVMIQFANLIQNIKTKKENFDEIIDSLYVIVDRILKIEKTVNLEIVKIN